MTHRVKKFLLRTNAPGHSEFNSYSKCNFCLDLEPSSIASSPKATSPSGSLDNLSETKSGDVIGLFNAGSTCHGSELDIS